MRTKTLRPEYLPHCMKGRASGIIELHPGPGAVLGRKTRTQTGHLHFQVVSVVLIVQEQLAVAGTTANKQIQVAVEIVVRPYRSIVGRGIVQAYADGHIGKRTVAVVPKQLVGGIGVGNKEIKIAIVVVVAPGHAFGVCRRARHTSGRSDISKCAIAVVAVQLIGSVPAQIEVQVAVVVVVAPGHAVVAAAIIGDAERHSEREGFIAVVPENPDCAADSEDDVGIAIVVVVGNPRDLTVSGN